MKSIKKLFLITSSSLFAILIASTAVSCAKSNSVTLKSDNLEIVGNTIARSDSDYKCTFKIKDDKIGDRYMDNIDVDTMSVSVDGKAIPVEGFSFVYQTNAKNELTIQKQYLTGKVEISADLSKRTQKHNCFFFEYDIDAYANFNDIEIIYPVESKQGCLEAIDLEKTKSIDDIYLNDGYDIAIIPKEIASILGANYNILLLREDNSFKVKIKAKEGTTLPKNIWLRSNARYTKKDEDFTIAYSSDYKTAELEIPYFFIRDNGSFRTNPDAEA